LKSEEIIPVNPDGIKRIFIVDDHPLIRRGLRQLFEAEPEITVCGEAATIAEGISGIKSSAPDLVIVDISLPDGSGLDLIKRLHAFNPDQLILVSSMHDEKLMAERVLRAGAMGYVSKQETPEYLIDAVNKVLSGKVYLSESITEQVLINRYANTFDMKNHSPIETLSNRELEVFEQIGAGNSTMQIAEHLNLSVKTIETHRTHIKEKLNLSSSPELVRYAIQWSLGGVYKSP
jgi:DNA-binding NarL/FixJ family response regulator